MFCRIVAIYLDTDFIIFTSTVYVCISIILLCQPDLDYLLLVCIIVDV